MGLFYIYTNKSTAELYDSIIFSNACYKYIDPDDVYNLEKIDIVYKTHIISDFWQSLICVELLPHYIILHNGVCFDGKLKMKWDDGWEWLYKNGYDRAKNLILEETYSTVNDAVDGVKYFCDLVAKTKATEYLLLGCNFSK